MKAPTRQKPRNPRGQTAKAQSLGDLAKVVRKTTRLWRKHHLGYDQTKYVVEQVRRRLSLHAPAVRSRTVERLDRAEVERLITSAYRDDSQQGLMIKTLFLTGTRVSEFVQIRVEDLHLNDAHPRSTLPMPRARPTATYPSYRPWRRSCAPICKANAKAISSRAIATRATPCGQCRRS
jgi:integrase